MQKTSKQDSSKFSLSLELLFQSKEKAAVAKKAVLPELNAKHAKRSKTSIGIKNRIISIDIKAQDPTAMRASLNGCLNSIILTEAISEV